MSLTADAFPLWQRFTSVIDQHRSKSQICIMPMIISGYPDKIIAKEYVETLLEIGVPTVEIVDPISGGWAESTNAMIRSAHLLAIRQSLPGESVATAQKFPGSLKIFYEGSIQKTLVEDLSACAQSFSIAQLAIPVNSMPNQLNEFPMPITTMVSAESSLEALVRSARAAKWMVVCKIASATGGKLFPFARIAESLEAIKSVTNVPVFCTFGISTPSEIALLRSRCDGVIIGTALLEQLAKDISVVRGTLESFQQAAVA